MNVLLLAPQPFYTERGTPIAVNLLLRALSERGEQVDLLTYPAGADVAHPGLRIARIARPPLVRQVPPGFSIPKVLCDLAMAPRAASMAGAGRYDVVHAVEESVFIAMRLKRRFGLPYIYDMDSSLAQQMADKTPLFRLIAPLLRAAERSAIRGSAAAVPMCDALADMARDSGASRVVTLRDISLLDVIPPAAPYNPKEAFGLRGPCLVYLGNLEVYQGIDLLLQGFARLRRQSTGADLVIIGGTAGHIAHYTRLAGELGVGDAVHFAGPKPLGAMKSIFEAADILVSPRSMGNNTPMKIYSYMDSGRAILATKRFTHTQVMDGDSALLAEPEPEAFAAAMKRLIEDADLRRKLASNAKAIAAARYSYAAYRKTVDDLYDGFAKRG